METGAESACLFLGIKLQPGPIERHRLDNFGLNNTVDALKQEAGNRANVATTTLELIHRGRVLEDSSATLSNAGVRSGEMVHVVRKKAPPTELTPTYTDTELQQIVTSLRSFGCTPNAPGWTRAMQVLDDEDRLEELLEAVPGLAEDCSALSMLHEIELLAALGATLSTMKRGAAALPCLPAALRQLGNMLKKNPPPTVSDTAPTSGFAYSLEALSEDEDGDEEEDESSGGRSPAITQQQLAAAIRMAQENASSPSSNRNLLQLLQASSGNGSAADSNAMSQTPTPTPGGSRNAVTLDMFSNAVAEALLNRSTTRNSNDTSMELNTTASSSQSENETENPENYSRQLQHMHDMGLLDDAVNLRALLVCNGDVNAAINFVFTSMEE